MLLFVMNVLIHISNPIIFMLALRNKLQSLRQLSDALKYQNDLFKTVDIKSVSGKPNNTMNDTQHTKDDSSKYCYVLL